MAKRETVSALATAILFLCMVSTNGFAENWHGIGITTDLSWDSGDYGGGDTINTYSGTITIDYTVTPRFSLSLSIVPYVYQNETYTDVVLVRGRVVHYKDKYGINPHHKKDVGKNNNESPSSTDNSGTGTSDVSNNDHDNQGASSTTTQQTSTHHDTDSNTQVDHHEDTHNTHTTSKTDSSTATDSDVTGHDTKSRDSSKTKSTKTDNHMAAQSISNGSGPLNQKTEQAGQQKRKRYKRHGSAGGFGDMTLKASYFILDETEFLPQTAIKAGVKFPTADEDDGLGTGEFDYLVGMDLSKEVGRFSLFGGFCYNILGDPDYYDLNNYLSGYAGLSTEVLPNFYTSVEVDAAGPASDESDSELSLGLELGYDFGTPGYLAAGASKGLSDGSPDFSVYMSYSISF